MVKKAQIVSMYDIAAWVILILGLSVWLIILKFENIQHDKAIENKVIRLNSEEVMITLMRSEIEGERAIDLVMSSYLSGEKEYVKNRLDELLAGIYGSEVCWKLSIEDQPFITFPCRTDSSSNLLESAIYSPIREGDAVKAVKIAMLVEGYKNE